MKKLKKSKNVNICLCVAIVIVAALIVAEIIILTTDLPKKALKEANFEDVRIEAYSQLATISSDEEDEDVQQVAGESSEKTEEEWPQLSEQEVFGEMIVSGDKIYNQDEFGKCYFVLEDENCYEIRFVDDDLWDDSDLGSWQKSEIPEANIESKLLFPLSAIVGLTKKDFEEQDGFYTIKNEKERFCEILQIKQAEHYACDYMRFYFEDGKLSCVKLAYFYMGNLYVANEYRFTYENCNVELPKVDDR